MEILQTIWTALTTENEMLAKILVIPISYIEIFLGMLLFSTLLKCTADRRSKIAYVLIAATISNISNFAIPNPYKSLINLFVVFACVKVFFKTNIIKTILATFIPIFFSVLGESVILKLASFLFTIDMKAITMVPLNRFLLALSVQFTVFLMYLLIKYFKLQISVLENMSKKSRIIFLLNIIFAVIAMVLQFFITGFYMTSLPVYIVLFSNISLIVYLSISLYSLTKTTQLEIANLNLEQEKEHNRLMKIAQDDLRGFRHDFSNIMCTIGGYVQVKDMDGLTKYYSQIQKDISKVNNLGALDPAVINHPAVFTLLASKYNKASEEQITMNINCFLDLNELNMKIYEFTRVLGILLDNAIEAAKECDEKIINVEIRKETNRNRQLLIIENTYQEKNIDTDKIYEKNYSTKEGNTGLGLWEVRQILKRNHNLNLFTTTDDIYFKQQLEMYNL